MKIGYWEICQEEFTEILRENGINPAEFDMAAFDKCMNLSLKDRTVGDGDPWRMGRDFHIVRALDMMKNSLI